MSQASRVVATFVSFFWIANAEAQVEPTVSSENTANAENAATSEYAASSESTGYSGDVARPHHAAAWGTRAPSSAPAEPIRTKGRPELWIPGIVIAFGGSVATFVGATATDNLFEPKAEGIPVETGLIPVVGGFIGAMSPNASERQTRALLIGSGMQVVGLGAIVTGFAWRRPVWEVEDYEAAITVNPTGVALDLVY